MGGLQLIQKNNKLYPIIYLTTISKKLSDQLLNIFKRLDLRSTCYYWDAGGNRQRAYRVVIRGDEMVNKFMKMIKPSNLKYINIYNSYKQSLKNLKNF